MRSWRRCSGPTSPRAGTSATARRSSTWLPKLVWTEHQAEAVLNSDDGLEAIKEADELARRFRVEGVPFFIVNGKITLSGAQQPDAFLEAFARSLAATT